MLYTFPCRQCAIDALNDLSDWFTEEEKGFVAVNYIVERPKKLSQLAHNIDSTLYFGQQRSQRQQHNNDVVPTWF